MYCQRCGKSLCHLLLCDSEYSNIWIPKNSPKNRNQISSSLFCHSIDPNHHSIHFLFNGYAFVCQSFPRNGIYKISSLCVPIQVFIFTLYWQLKFQKVLRITKGIWIRYLVIMSHYFHPISHLSSSVTLPLIFSSVFI